MAQFKRIIRLTVGQPGKDGVVIENLKMTFDIDKDLTQQTNKSTVKIFNLAPETRKKVERPDSICILEVGYQKDIGRIRIFIGAILQAKTVNEGGNLVTELELADGQVAVRDSVISIGYSAGTNGKKIVQDIAAQMGLILHMADDVTFSDYPNGYSYAGYAKTALDKVCNACGATWSIQNNELQVIKGGGTTGIRALVFSAASGLIGNPERIAKGVRRADSDKEPEKKKNLQAKKIDKQEEKYGWKIKNLLAPTINPGDTVRVESKAVTGWFKVEKLKHSGDTHGNEWYTEQELSEVSIDEPK